MKKKINYLGLAGAVTLLVGVPFLLIALAWEWSSIYSHLVNIFIGVGGATPDTASFMSCMLLLLTILSCAIGAGFLVVFALGAAI